MLDLLIRFWAGYPPKGSRRKQGPAAATVATENKEGGGGEQEEEGIKTTRMLITGGIGAALPGAHPAKKSLWLYLPKMVAA